MKGDLVDTVSMGSEIQTVPTVPNEGIARFLPDLPSYLEHSLDKLSDDKLIGNHHRNFTAEEKDAFVRRYLSNGLRIVEACSHIGTSIEALYRHMAKDPDWESAFMKARLTVGENVSAMSLKVALTPEGVTDRGRQLRRFFPKEYGNSDDNQRIGLQINLRPWNPPAR